MSSSSKGFGGDVMFHGQLARLDEEEPLHHQDRPSA
jgi:hypothetical protein